MSEYGSKYIPHSSDSSLTAKPYSVVLFDSLASDPREIFSTSSTTLAPKTSAVNNVSYISWSSASVAVCLICLYCWFTARFRKCISASFKAVTSTGNITTLLYNQASDFKPYLRIGELIFVIAVALQFVSSFFGHNHSLSNALLVPITVFYIYFALFTKQLLNRLIDIFDQNSGRFRLLEQIGRFDIAISSIVVGPSIILCSIDTNLYIVALSVIALAVALHWWRIFVFFNLSGFSILQCILYLCTLEVIPFTLFIGVTARLEM